MFSNLDVSLTLAPNGGGNQVRLFDPSVTFPLYFDDGVNGDARDGIYVQGLRPGEGGRQLRDLRLYTGWNGTGSLAISPSTALSAVMTTLDGKRFVFDVIDLGSVRGNPLPLTGLAPWVHLDVGRVAFAGTASQSNGAITVQGAGQDIWSTNDQFHYAYQAMRGDGAISAHVDSLDAINGWEKGGVMIRASLHESAAYAAMYATPGAGAAFQWRTAFGGNAGGINGGTLTIPSADTTVTPVPLGSVKAPCWVRVVRSGSTFTGQVSLDNLVWTTVGTQTISLPQDVYVGLAVTSHIPAAVGTGVFSSVAMTGAATPSAAWPATDLYHDQRGRLVQITDAAGYGFTVAYRYNPTGHPSSTPDQQAAIAESPDRQWQMDHATDFTGKTLTMSYNAAQIAGKWVVSDIAVPNGSHITYAYGTDGQINQVHLPDGTQSTFARSYDPVSQCTVVAYDDASASGTHRRKQAYLTNNFSQHIDGGYDVVYNQSSLLLRMVLNGAGEVSYMNSFDPANWGVWWVYEGGVKLRQMSGTAIRYYLPGWQYDPTKVGAARWIGGLESFGYTRDLGGNWGNLAQNTPAAVTLESGEKRTFQYDADHVPTAVGWSDGTTASYTYDTWKRPTRVQDRLGRVTRTTYDGVGNKTQEEAGILVVNGVDTPQSDYTKQQWIYYPDGDPNQRLLAAAIDANGNRTDYAYDANHRLASVTEPADTVGGPRAVTQYAYDAAGRLASMTDASGRVTKYAYDARDRISAVTYADGSSDRSVYGAPGTPDANLLVKSFNRDGVATAFTYDLAGRQIQRVEAASMVLNGSEQAITDPAIRHVETMTYLAGTELLASRTVAGTQTVYTYDTHHRETAWTVYPRAGAGLTTTQTYANNLLFSTTDPYGRKSYNIYRASDAQLVRTVRGLLPTFSATAATLPTLARDTSTNPAYVIEDLNLDAIGQVIGRVDGRGTTTAYAYDNLGRVVAQTEDASGTPAITQYSFDAAGNCRSSTSPRGEVIAMTYTGRNLLAAVVEAAGTSVAATTRTLTYTLTGKPASETDANGNTTGYSYGVCCDRLVTITDTAGFTTQFTYDPVGNRLTVTDGNGLTTTTAYDARNRVSSVTNPAGEQTSYRYDESLVDGVGLDATAEVQPVLASLGLTAGLAEGSAMAVTNPNHETSYELRDGIGRPVVRIDGLGHATTTAYDTITNNLVETATVDALGHTIKVHADGAGLVRETVDALGKFITIGYDADGNQVIARDANLVGWGATFDLRNHMIARNDTGGGSTAWSYDLDGNRLTETDALGKSELYAYDDRNRRIQQTDRLGGITRFAYDAVGNLVQISDADNEAKGGLANLSGTTQYGYDVRNLLVAEAFPAGQAGRTLRTYGYDGGRRLAGRSVGILAGAFANPLSFLGAAESTGYAYDAANRIIIRRYADGLNDTFAYDLASRLSSATSVRYADVVARTYDAAGRLIQESLSLPDGTMSGTTVAPATYQVGYTYDAANRLVGLTYPTGTTVARTYSVRNELASVTMGGKTVATRTYDAGGRQVTTIFGNGLIETLTYVTGDVLVANSTTAPTSGPVVSGFSYTYDLNKRKLTETDVAAGRTQTFGYDDSSRLTSWNRSGGGPAPSAQTWNLSRVGDWNTTTRDGVAESRVNNSVHEAVQVGTNTLAYDAKGNITRDEHGSGLAWDPENRLTRAAVTPDASTTGLGVVATYRYDALGRRIAKTVQNRTTLYLDAGAQSVVELERAAIPAQADINGATSDGTLANAAQVPASGGILPTDHGVVTRINFQPATTVIPTGFLADKGKPNAMRTNGLTYGWSSDVTAQAMERDGIDLMEWDTLIQAQTDTNASTWSIALPNGTYPVVVVAGDAASTNQTDNLVIGGVTVTDGTPATTTPSYDRGNFDGYAVSATVTNGTLTITPGSGAYHAKLCFVEIGAADTPANVAAAVAAVQTKLAVLVQKMNDQTGAPLDPINKVREFAYGSYLDEVLGYQRIQDAVPSRYYPHYNHLYSIAVITDGNGALIERRTYSSYGGQLITNGVGIPSAKSPVGFSKSFTGFSFDEETGYCYARARMYIPNIGTFANQDPMRYIDGYSLYNAYFVPSNVDPLGMHVTLASGHFPLNVQYKKSFSLKGIVYWKKVCCEKGPGSLTKNYGAQKYIFSTDSIKLSGEYEVEKKFFVQKIKQILRGWVGKAGNTLVDHIDALLPLQGKITLTANGDFNGSYDGCRESGKGGGAGTLAAAGVIGLNFGMGTYTFGGNVTGTGSIDLKGVYWNKGLYVTANSGELSIDGTLSLGAGYVDLFEMKGNQPDGSSQMTQNFWKLGPQALGSGLIYQFE